MWLMWIAGLDRHQQHHMRVMSIPELQAEVGVSKHLHTRNKTQQKCQVGTPQHILDCPDDIEMS